MPHVGETDGRETVFDAGPMVWRFVDTGEPVPLRSDAGVDPDPDPDPEPQPPRNRLMPEFHEYRDYLYDDFEFRQDSDTGLGVVTGTIVQVW